MKRVLILGAGGQLGRELVSLFPESYGMYHGKSGDRELDVSDLLTLEKKILAASPDLIINASALANVDRCEKEREYAIRVNGYSVKVMAQCARKLNIPLVHISTDYVFDGENGNYSEDDVPNPINYYGLSKLVGDIYANSYENSLVVRTSGVYGYASNFPKFVYSTLKAKNTVNAISGFYSPIHARNLALAIKELFDRNYRGIINVAGERISRYDLAVHIADFFGLPKDHIKEAGEIKSMIAKRPFDSSLNIDKAKSILVGDFYSLRSNLVQFSESVTR
ncbi:MAG: SDR family oxidoreductase [Thermoplasmatales archaeon]